MKTAYVDTSYLVAILFREAGWQRLRTALRPYQLIASELVAAELLAVLRREQLSPAAAKDALAAIHWVFPDRSLRPEIDQVLARAYVRGADLWHLACACFIAPDPVRMSFLTCDERQREIAAAIGFPIS